MLDSSGDGVRRWATSSDRVDALAVDDLLLPGGILRVLTSGLAYVAPFVYTLF